ncbi:MAG: hypothetical protein ABJA37_04280 [Ferruginibacter sp.]
MSVFTWTYYHQVAKVKFGKNINIMVCGDSHTESAVNDEILQHSINISHSSEPYFYTYNVIKTLINNNPRINTIIMGYSFHSLSGSYDVAIFKEEFTKTMYPDYLPILDARSISTLVSKNIYGISRSIPNVLKNMFYSILNKPSNVASYPFIGHYYKSRNSNINDSTINKAIMRHYYKKDSAECEFSAIQEEYLKQIIQFCNNRNIKLILLSTPVSKGYYDKIPIKFVNNYYLKASEFKQQANLLDLHDLKLSKECYGDGDHINEYGAKILTTKLDSLLIRPLNDLH